MFLSFGASGFAPDFRVRQKNLFKSFASPEVFAACKATFPRAVDTCSLLDPTVLPLWPEEKLSLLSLPTLNDSFGGVPRAAQPGGWRGTTSGTKSHHKQLDSGFRWAALARHGAQTESEFLRVIFSVHKDDSTGVQHSRVLPERNLLCLVKRHSIH